MMAWRMVSIREVARIHYGKALKAEDRVESGQVPVFGSSGELGYHNTALVTHPTLVVGRKGSVGEVTFAPNGGWPIDTVFYLELMNTDEFDLRYFYYALKRARLARWTITTSIPGLNRDDFYNTRFPLPPLSEQRRIADILDRADAIRGKRQKAIRFTDEFLRSTFLEMFGDPVTNPKGWDMRPLSEMAEVNTGNTPFRKRPDYYGSDIEWINALSPKGGTDPYFLYVELWLSKRLIQTASTDSMKGMVSKGRLSTIEVPSPPPEEQEVFGQFFRRFVGWRRTTEKTSEEAKYLFDSLVQRAFRGEL